MSPSPRTDSVPSDSDSDSGSSQGYEDVPGAEDDEEMAVPAVCLFCELTLPSAHGVFAHCAHCHGFDWKTTVKTLGGRASLQSTHAAPRTDQAQSTGRSRLLWAHQAHQLHPYTHRCG